MFETSMVGRVSVSVDKPTVDDVSKNLISLSRSKSSLNRISSVCPQELAMCNKLALI